MKYKIKHFLFFLLFPAISFAQQAKVDSLLHFLKSAKEDTTKVNALTSLSAQYTYIANFDAAMHYGNQAKELAETIQLPDEKSPGWLKGLGNALFNLGLVYTSQEKYKEGLDYYWQSLEIFKKLGRRLRIADVYNNIGVTYWRQGNMEKTLEIFLKSLKITEEIGDKKRVAVSYTNIGLVYFYQEKYDEALKNYFKALKMRDDKLFVSKCYNNIGVAYEKQGNLASTKTMANYKYQKALEVYSKSLKIMDELDDKTTMSVSYSNIGNIYLALGKIALNKEVSENYYEKALVNHFKGLQIAKEINSSVFTVHACNGIGNVYLEQNKLEDAYDYLNQALTISKEQEDKSSVKDVYFSLSNLFERKQDYKQALGYRKLYSDIKDTLLNEASTKQIVEMNAKFDTEKKDKELIKKDAEIIKQQAESEKQQTQRNTFIIGFGLVLVLAFFIFRGYRQKKEANTQLEAKNIAISKQNIEIEKKNMVITDSIEYAKNIQSAILPTDEELKKYFQNYFILYKPKDIVSGDFYWINEQEDYLLFAVADCTGHGVPGAFMSLMGHNLLREIVSSKNSFSPSEILDELNLKVLKTLKQDSKNSSAKYGMDIALISIDKKKNTIEFAGAHNPIYIFRDKECIQLKAEARSIGSFPKESEKGFSNQSFQLQKGDMLYMFSDGYTDQKGGPESKKFFSKPFRELLQNLCELDILEQQDLLNTTILSWKGNKKQTDDILVVGIRV